MQLLTPQVELNVTDTLDEMKPRCTVLDPEILPK